MSSSNSFLNQSQELESETLPLPNSNYARYIKRLLDVFVAFLMLVMVTPVILTLAFIIKWDGAPAFYGQPRLGRDGKIFTCWKLRSMQPNADRVLIDLLRNDHEAAIEWARDQKLRKDPRITSIGRVIRKFSFDELPQLWNVLRGDMSLVGPRPMMPEQMISYPGRSYLLMRPGLTGFWQISDRSNSTFAARAEHDTHYLEEISLHTDVSVLLKTVLVVVRGTGV